MQVEYIGEHWKYIDSKGKETWVKDMDHNHLLNAYAKAVRNSVQGVIDALGFEISKRLQERDNLISIAKMEGNQNA